MTNLKKNDIIEGVVCGYTSEGAGVLKKDGYPLFVNGAAKGDVLRVRVLKALKRRVRRLFSHAYKLCGSA